MIASSYTEQEVSSSQLQAQEQLKNLNHWVVWKLENVTNEKTGESRKTKVLYNARSGRKASSTDSTSWTSHKLAQAAIETYPDEYSGLGFVFNGNVVCLAGIDLDHCVDEAGNIDAWALTILQDINSYAEFSPSGTGIHIYVEAEQPTALVKGNPEHKGRKWKLKDMRDPAAAVEMYDRGRFFTYTGKHVPGTPETINKSQDALGALYARLDAKPEVERKKAKQQPRPERIKKDLSDDAIIVKAMHAKNGRKFHNLYRNGDLSAYSNDASAADQALCDMLAFWTNADARRMDNLFRSSALMRDKWDEMRGSQTYGEMTIATAIAHCRETYTGYAHINTEPLTNANGNGNGNGNGHHAQAATAQDDKPDVEINGQLRDVVSDALAALAKAERKNPTIFIQSSRIVKIACNEKGQPGLITLSVPELKNALTASANYYRVSIKNDEPVYTPVSPPKEIAEAILALEPAALPFPAIETIVETPIIREDGSVLDKPGYDAATCLYYYPEPSLKIPAIPCHPTQEQVERAAEYVLGFVSDFPFVAQADKANTIGLFITAVIRHLVRHVPCALINGTKAGTGKGLLTDASALISTGRTASSIAQVDSEEEWDKRITALLMSGATFISIDNVEGVLRSAILSKALTSDYHNGRILGMSKMVNVPQRATWIANGNNIQLGGDMPRRCYAINLAVQVSDPWTREDFKYPDLIGEIEKNRGAIIAAMLTMARGWFAAGKPSPKNKVAKLGTFSTWVDLAAGILSYAGIDGFLENIVEMHENADVDGKAWARFLEVWYTKLGKQELTTKALLEQLNADPDFAETLPDPMNTWFLEQIKSLNTKVGKHLGKKNGTPFGPDNLRIVKGEDSHTKHATFKVVPFKFAVDAVDAVLKSSLRSDEKIINDDDENKNNNNVYTQNIDIESEENLTPQPPQPPQTNQPSSSSSVTTDSRLVEVEPILRQARSLFWTRHGNDMPVGTINSDEYLHRLQVCLDSGDSAQVHAAQDDIERRLNIGRNR